MTPRRGPDSRAWAVALPRAVSWARSWLQAGGAAAWGPRGGGPDSRAWAVALPRAVSWARAAYLPREASQAAEECSAAVVRLRSGDQGARECLPRRKW